MTFITSLFEKGLFKYNSTPRIFGLKFQVALSNITYKVIVIEKALCLQMKNNKVGDDNDKLI
jgi:hypothetical protein